MAVLKALGMAPRQVVVMVISSVVPVALLAGLIGVPLGVVFQRAVLAYMEPGRGGDARSAAPWPCSCRRRSSAWPWPASRSPRSVPTCPAQRAARARIAPVLQAE